MVARKKRNKKRRRIHPELLVWQHKPLKAFLNILRVSWARRQRRRTVRGMPFVLFYDPTTFCNLKCPACPTGTGAIDRPREKVDPKNFGRAVDAIGDWVFKLYLYNWGEPLLHKDLPQMIRHAADRGISVYVSTNLSMPLDESQCAEIVNSGLYCLQVSIDGASPETHARYRRGSDLGIVHSNLRRIIRCRKELGAQTPKIKSMFLVFAHNENEVEQYKRQMEDIGVDVCSVTSAWIPSGGGFSAPEDPTYRKSDHIASTLRKLRSEGRSLKPCTWLYYVSVIGPGGAMSPCCAILSERFDFGELRFPRDPQVVCESFRSEWNGPKYGQARRLFRDGESIDRWVNGVVVGGSPDGCVLSQLQLSTPLICAKCFVPHTIHAWSDTARQLHRQFRAQVGRSMRAGDMRGVLKWWIRASILRAAAWVQ